MNGLRVVRGPNWKWGSEDGFEGCVGTVTPEGKNEGGVLSRLSQSLHRLVGEGEDL